MRAKHLALLAVVFLQLVPGVRAEPAARAASSAPLDLQGYTTELEQWRASAGRLRDHPEEAPALRKQLPNSLSVMVEEQRFQVSTRPLEEPLDQLIRHPKSAAAATQTLCSHLESMLEEAHAISQPSAHDYPGARAKLNTILKQREFRSVRAPNDSETFWDRWWDFLWKSIGRLVNRASGHPAIFNYLVWGIVIVFSLIFLAWLFYALTHVSSGRPAGPVRKDGDSAATRFDGVQQARMAAARGEYREAIRIIYGAAVCRLGETGAWQVDPSRTHREYARLLAADSVFRPPLVAITTCFEHVWYGHAPASVRDYEAALAQLESLS